MNRLFARWADFDRKTLIWTGKLVQSRISRWCTILIAHSGDSQWWLLAGFLFWGLGGEQAREIGKQIVIVTLITGLISGLCKQIFKRTRPNSAQYLLYLSFDRHSFPSGHATRVGALALVLAAGVPFWAIPLIIGWAICVGISRIALGVHFASDITAGLLLGAIIGSILLVWWR
jgi:undecaprenyl-diphosphatase